MFLPLDIYVYGGMGWFEVNIFLYICIVFNKRFR